MAIPRPPAEFCFQPAESEKGRNADRRSKRKTPIRPAPQNQRTPGQERRLTDRYSKDSYRRVIVRAVGRANRVIQEDAEHMGIEAPAPCRPGTRINSGIRPQPRYEETLAWRLPRLSWAIPRRIRRKSTPSGTRRRLSKS